MTTTYHTPIVTGAAANVSVVNAPLAELDAAIGTIGGGGGALAAETSARQAADAAEIVAREAGDAALSAILGSDPEGAYADVATRLANLDLTGNNIATLTNGVANAAQKVVVVDSTTGFLAGGLVAYTLVGGVIQTNTIDTVDSPTQITLITNIGTGGIANNTYFMAIPLGALVGTGATVGATGQEQQFTLGLLIGGNVPIADDSAIQIVRAATNPLSSGGSHGVRDESTYIAAGTGGYAAFDAIPKVEGALAYSHVAAFQARPIYDGSTSIDGVWGLTFNPIIGGAGTTVDCFGVYVTDPQGVGAITQLAGVYVGSLTRGTTNWGVYTAGTMPSFFGGYVDAPEFRSAGDLILKTNVHAYDAGNLILGHAAGNVTMTGHDNYAIGQYTLTANTTGAANIALGTSALQVNEGGASNVAVGIAALAANVAGNYNTAIGYLALTANTATYNTAIGYNALKAGVAVYYNTTIGAESLYSNTAGSGNVAVGYQAGYYETGSNKLFVDNVKRTNEADGRIKALIYGVFDAAVANQELTFNSGKMGFFGHAAAAQPTKAGHNNWAAVSDVVAALVAIGIFDAA